MFAAASTLIPPDRAAAQEAAARQQRLTKPKGSLGRLETLGAHLAAIARTCPPPVPEPATVAVFAGDHGVHEEGVTPWPQEVTAQMVANFCAGGAAISVLARHAGARVLVVDVGVAADLGPLRPPPEDGSEGDAPELLHRKVRSGTRNLAVEPALTIEETQRALDVGAEIAASAVAAGARCLVTGEMGIANSTPAAALIAAFTGRPPSEVTGRGTGIDGPTWARKVGAIGRGLARHRQGWDEPLPVVASLGGLEIVALAGFIVGGAAAGVPVVVDGLIAMAALEVAVALAPDAAGYCIAGHRSVDPGAAAVIDHLTLEPVLDLGMRLGEGTGACLALGVVQAAAKILREMATFDSAGITSDP